MFAKSFLRRRWMRGSSPRMTPRVIQPARSGAQPIPDADAGLDLAQDAHFARLRVGVFVLPEIFLAERIDVLRGALLSAAPHPPANLDVTIGIVGIDDRH